MARPHELKYPISRVINLDFEEYQQFKEIVGENNVSKEIRAMVHNFLEKEKKDVAQTDPLNLNKLDRVTKSGDDIIHIGIYESTDYCNEVRSLIKAESDNYKISRAKNNFYDLFRYCEGELRIRKEKLMINGSIIH